MESNITQIQCPKKLNQKPAVTEKFENNFEDIKRINRHYGKRQSVKCTWCGKEFYRYDSQIRTHNFCCNTHRISWWRKYTLEVINVKGHCKGVKRPDLSLLNKAKTGNKNPMSRPEVRKKVGDVQHDRGEGKSYRKLNKYHEHRLVVEQKIGRPLRSDEIVHHIDGNKRNNSLNNLMICTRAEHARIHFSKKVGDVSENIRK